MMKRKKKSDFNCCDVVWYDTSGKIKRPIYYSATSEGDFIASINWPRKTAKQLLKIIKEQYPYAIEEIKIMQAFIDAGLGDEIIKTRIPQSGYEEVIKLMADIMFSEQEGIFERVGKIKRKPNKHKSQQQLTFDF